MANGGGDLPPLEFSQLCTDTNCAGFSCSNNEINRWLQRKALKQHLSGSVVVTCAHERGRPQRPLGLYALATVAEEVRSLPGAYHRFRQADHFSALQLVWLATDRAFTRRGLGELMVGQVIRTFAAVGPQIGLPHLIVIPAEEDYERLVRFYTKLGFATYPDGEAMFLPIQSATQAVEAEQAELEAAAIPIPNPEPEGE